MHKGSMESCDKKNSLVCTPNKSLEVRFQKTLQAFSLQVDLTVKAGEILAILGSSGAGKSMTLKCIAGLEQPEQGYMRYGENVWYDLERHNSLPPQKRKTGYLFQEYGLFPHLTAEQNIRIAQQIDAEEVEKFVKDFELTELLQRYPGQLSGGQKQRIAFVRMLASNPDVILLDEPFSALHNALRNDLRSRILKTLRQMEKPVILVSHSEEDVLEMSDRICVLTQGEMSEPVSTEVYLAKQELLREKIFPANERLVPCEEGDEAWAMRISYIYRNVRQ